jgi:outer membrane lipoprotein-sorting protein
MRKKFFIGLTLIVAVSVALFGFSCGPAQETEKSSQTTIDDLRSLNKKYNEFSYDMEVVDPNGTTVTTKVYMKDTMMRTETTVEKQEVIFLGDTQGVMYSYYPANNSAMKIDISSEEMQDLQEENPIESIDDFWDQLTILRHETYDGKQCAVAELKMGDGYSQTIWIWEKYGLPIKTEIVSAEGTSTVVIRNIEFGNVSDSMFELPANVDVVDLNDIMEGNFDPSMFEGMMQ